MSVTVQVTVVLPIGKVAGALLLAEATPQLSSALTEPKVAVAVQEFNAAVTVTAGAVMVGNCVSFTVTVNEAVATKP